MNNVILIQQITLGQGHGEEISYTQLSKASRDYNFDYSTAYKSIKNKGVYNFTEGETVTWVKKIPLIKNKRK